MSVSENENPLKSSESELWLRFGPLSDCGWEFTRALQVEAPFAVTFTTYSLQEGPTAGGRGATEVAGGQAPGNFPGGRGAPNRDCVVVSHTESLIDTVAPSKLVKKAASKP